MDDDPELKAFVNALLERIKSLKARLRRYENPHVPSSKRIIKEMKIVREPKPRGAPEGHRGSHEGNAQARQGRRAKTEVVPEVWVQLKEGQGAEEAGENLGGHHGREDHDEVHLLRVPVRGLRHKVRDEMRGATERGELRPEPAVSLDLPALHRNRTVRQAGSDKRKLLRRGHKPPGLSFLYFLRKS